MPSNIDGVLRWSVNDVEAGRCSPSQLWRRVNPVSGVVEGSAPAPDLNTLPADQLRADVLAAYQAAGGTAYLQKMAEQNPAHFFKLLVRILPQTLEADIRSRVNVRALSAAADHLFEVRARHSLCQAYPWATCLSDGRRVVEVGQLPPQHFRLMAGQVNLPAVPGQHFVTFEERNGKWFPVEVRDQNYELLEGLANVA